ncbi:MAG: ribonuclease P protein component [Rhodospirillales bacterium]
MAQKNKKKLISKIKKRADFLKASKADFKYIAPSVIVQAREHTNGEIKMIGSLTSRVGFTVSKKVGNSVIRNLIKRRLRAAARSLMPKYSMPNHDIVIIGRKKTIEKTFTEILTDLKKALIKLSHQ